MICGCVWVIQTLERVICFWSHLCVFTSIHHGLALTKEPELEQPTLFQLFFSFLVQGTPLKTECLQPSSVRDFVTSHSWSFYFLQISRKHSSLYFLADFGYVEVSVKTQARFELLALIIPPRSSQADLESESTASGADETGSHHLALNCLATSDRVFPEKHKKPK